MKDFLQNLIGRFKSTIFKPHFLRISKQDLHKDSPSAAIEL